MVGLIKLIQIKKNKKKNYTKIIMIEICQERKELFSIFHKGESFGFKTKKSPI